jgi:hypothetical protein
VRIFYRRFGTTYRSHLQRSRSPLPQSWYIWPIRCPDTSVKDYHSTLRNTPAQRRSQKYTCLTSKTFQILEIFAWHSKRILDTRSHFST